MWRLLGMLLASPKKVEITGLHRHPIKGMGAEHLKILWKHLGSLTFLVNTWIDCFGRS